MRVLVYSCAVLQGFVMWMWQCLRCKVDRFSQYLGHPYTKNDYLFV